jgi:hypothetical protein
MAQSAQYDIKIKGNYNVIIKRDANSSQKKL